MTITPYAPPGRGGNFYSGSPVDRAAHHRADAARIASYLVGADTLFVPCWRGLHLIVRDPDDRARIELPTRRQTLMTPEFLEGTDWIFLGYLDERPLFVLDLSLMDQPELLFPQARGRFVELRPLASLLPPDEAAILAQARGLVHWRNATRFCGACGAPNQADQAGHRLVCTADPGHLHFPRTDPVVIMLVQRRDRVLLARGVRFGPESRTLSALAGFVEPGETPEEAVAREVLEETGVPVGEIRYHSSQPWPYPGTLMLAFTATATDDTLRLDPDEIVEARWLTRDDIRNHAALGFTLPASTTIARRMIEDWLTGAP
ncbi:NUDIX hydrolase [Gluconacetobacter johannae DSM 13595]|uniref:NAD(+) diphosphatase n=1 Tax=Gluconacetobacter johannae TaxID=112140 RepID=A0A7W4J675_9PROT|nr:NAD(+) diphosphatase [Gluconacetobacter johannae]MBB2175426.1 NAD(+) diphosphatase [Gluconacetobacter johannae]GBQ88833.1 NUDIX hydrolase [Gluconacetobacter johannae DSM 13595]